MPFILRWFSSLSIEPWLLPPAQGNVHPFIWHYQLFSSLLIDFDHHTNMFLPLKKNHNHFSFSSYCPIHLLPFVEVTCKTQVKNNKDFCSWIAIIFYSFFLETTPNWDTKNSSYSHLGPGIATCSVQFSAFIFCDP